jgi:hypothetical protein
MAGAVIPSPRSLQSINIADSTSNSEEPPAKRIRSSRSVASATACATVHPTVYRRLDKTKREIRICDLHFSSEISAPLICSLRIVSLDKVGRFVSFSYVWGQEPSTETITINGFQHQIRPNLATGLRRFRANYYQSSSGKRGNLAPYPSGLMRYVLIRTALKNAIIKSHSCDLSFRSANMPFHGLENQTAPAIWQWTV